MTTPDEAVSMPTIGQERSSIREIDSNLTGIRAVAFSASGDHVLGGGAEGVRVWRVEDGKEVASKLAKDMHVRCLAVSKDGRWIAAWTYQQLIVWDAKTYELVFAQVEAYLNGVDFSPDSTRLVTGSLNTTASVWDIPARKRVVGPLTHKDVVVAAKYSPDGTRIATATPHSVHVYDSNDGQLLANVQVRVPPWFNNGLLWSKQALLFLSDGTIKHIDSSTGSQISEWAVPDSADTSCIALPHHGEYIAYATKRTVTLWDMSTRSQLKFIWKHPQDIRSIAISSDDHFLVIAGESETVTLNSLAQANDSIPLSRLHPTFQEPDIHIDDDTLDAWKRDQLEHAEMLLTAAIPTSQDSNHHILAGRALIRTRLGEWDTALGDAEESIKMHPSVAGYIAKSIALVGKGNKYDGYRACDIAFERFHSAHVSFILLVKAIIVFMAGDHVDAISRVNDLIATVNFNSICYVVQAYMYHLLGDSYLDRGDYEHAIQYLERARTQVRSHTSRSLFVISLISGWKFDGLDVTIQKQLCEALFAGGRTKEAGESLLQMVNAIEEVGHVGASITAWLPDFAQRCLSTQESSRDVVSEGPDDLPVPPPLLNEWVKLKLTSCSWSDTLSAAASFTVPRFMVYRVICERLGTLHQVTDATNCFHRMIHELRGKPSVAGQSEWILDFKQCFSEKHECRGDAEVVAQRYDEAISEYSAALSLDPASPQGLLIKRSKTYVAKGLWEDALNDANEIIKLDPSSPWGYERKHAALHQAKDYDHAIDAFEAMLSSMMNSPDPEIRQRRRDYVKPSDTRTAIRRVVQDTIRDSPRVLINTISGRLLDKSKQASAFESLQIYKEMISSMTTNVDYTRIEQEVTQYYRYATFSHRWEENEPLFDEVLRIVVYDLEESDTHNKLQTFCKLVRDAGFHWAWSDTCCIDKTDHFVLQEALVSMFRWYEGSSVTIVFLRDICSPARRGDLVKSIWNTRAWTFQEYHASKVVRFYTADWKPYLNLNIPNHKEAPEIISEMEEATGVSAQTLTALGSGLEDIREKLCLASKRETTLVEDAAYSLLGVFAMTLPIVYGEGDKALGRLLAQLLTSSGDTNILAWAGKSGTYNTCLPANITVFEQLPKTHIPKAINETETDRLALKLHLSSHNLDHAQKLYDKLIGLSVPVFIGRRLKLPCIMFKLGPLSVSRNTSERVYRAQTNALGVVEIKTKEDLSRLETLYLVHPWIDFLLHRHPVGSITETITPEGSSDDRSSSTSELSPFAGPSFIPQNIKRTRTSQLAARLGLQFGGRSASAPPVRDAMSLLPPSSISQIDKRLRVLQFVVRLRQPFGALLFTPTRQYIDEYRRVACESEITVRVLENAPLNTLSDHAQMLDVL